jgi:Fic family protein
MLDAGLPRRDRQPCAYDAYVPDPLGGRAFALAGDVAADVADAEAAIIKLDREAHTLADTEALARLLLRAESVASSRIEGLEVGGRRLLRADMAQQLGEDPRDVTAVEVLGNIDAMVWGIRADDRQEITLIHLLEMHRRLLTNTRLQAQAGKLRLTQNWIGGSSYNPCSAQFVPPPPELVPDLMRDLCEFCSDDALPAVAQAAIAHAQFETIHPFPDGNGRIGRALIHMIFRRRGLTPRVLAPVSLILATRATDYVEGLTATRFVGDAGGREAAEGINRWLATFAGACTQAALDAGRFEQRINALQHAWRARLGRVRAHSAAERLIERLPGSPIVTVASAAALIGRGKQQTNEAIGRLAGVGILQQITVGRRNRAFEATDIVDAFTDLERQMASPAGDTLVEQPARSTPRRRPSP